MPDVPDLLQRSQKVKHQSTSVRVGGAPVAAKIGAIMGVDAGAGEKKVAFVKCAGTCDKTQKDYEYTGNEDCASMMFVPNGGPKACNYGCLGFGSCVKACPFEQSIS